MRALDNILRDGMVAIVRSVDADSAVRTGMSLLSAGVSAVEVSLVTPGALEAVAELSRRAPRDVEVGVGTVLEPAQVEAAAVAGATFIVAPTTSQAVIEAASAHGLVSIPGAATPSEAVQALQWGADLVKIFPASLWSPAALRDVLAALPELPAVPTGGITVQSASDWMRAGAVAVGVGSILSSAPDVAGAVRDLRAAIAVGREGSRAQLI